MPGPRRGTFIEATPHGVTALKTTIWAAAQPGAFPARGHLNRLSPDGDPDDNGHNPLIPKASRRLG